jgi:hypothetical protein
MSRLWLRAFVAFLIMEGLTAMRAAVWHVYGSGRGAEVREFDSAFAYALFVSVVSVPFHLGALFGMFLPVAVLLQVWRWSLNLTAAILAGAALSVPAFSVVVVGGWLIDGWGSLSDYGINVLRFPRSNAILLAVFAVGGAIVLSGLRNQRRSTPSAQLDGRGLETCG